MEKRSLSAQPQERIRLDGKPRIIYHEINMKGIKGRNKSAAAFLSFVFFTSSVSAQSLVELANKEQLRRENVKGKKSLVITNADLERSKLKPALSPSPAEIKAEEIKPETLQEGTQPEPATPQESPAELSKAQASLESLEEKWKRAEEYLELLTLKMNALWLEFYSMGSMTSKDSIQQQIFETNIKLEKARLDAEQAKKDYEQALAKKKQTEIR